MAVLEIAVGEDESVDAYEHGGQPRLRLGGDCYVSLNRRHAKDLLLRLAQLSGMPSVLIDDPIEMDK